MILILNLLIAFIAYLIADMLLENITILKPYKIQRAVLALLFAVIVFFANLADRIL